MKSLNRSHNQNISLDLTYLQHGVTILVFFITLLLMPKILKSQNSIENFSFNSKIGTYSTGAGGGFARSVELNAIRKGLLYSIDFYDFSEVNIFGGNLPIERYNQLGLMIGKHYGEKLFRLELQAGIAPIWGLRRTDFLNRGEGIFSSDIYDSEKFFTTGLVTKVGLNLNAFRHMGLGLDFQANFNPNNTIIAVLLSVGVGKIRSNKL